VKIRPAEDADWPAIAALLRAVVEDGETYAYAGDLDDDTGWARDLGFEVVGTVPGVFESRRHGRVGLHVMHRTL
jgi:L-amino acid N-acyltransferase YncA